VIQAFEDLGKLDNTLIIYINGDNGTSAEGGPLGTPNEVAFFNGVSVPVDAQLAKFYDVWGTEQTYNHMSAGWSWMFDAPFSWFKQNASQLGGTGQTAACYISLDLATVDASDLYRNFCQGRHLRQTGLGRGTIAGEDVAEINVVLAKAMPVVSVTAAMKSRHWNAEGKCAIAQQRQIEAVATEGHEDWAGPTAIHGKGFDEAEQYLGLGLFTDRSAADLGHRPRAAAIFPLGVEGGDGDDPVDRHLEEDRRRVLVIARVTFSQHPSDFGIMRAVRLCKKAARYVEVGNGFNVEENQHCHGLIRNAIRNGPGVAYTTTSEPPVTTRLHHPHYRE
jgi:hypothetical protein